MAVAMIDLRSTGRRRLRRLQERRRKTTPLAASVALALGSVGALAWVAPRTGVKDGHSSTSQGASDAGYLASETAALQRLAATVAAQQAAVAALAQQPGFDLSAPAAAAPPAAPPPSLPAISLPPPPAVHATTGASGVP